MAHALADSKKTPQARLECADSCLKGSGGFIRLWARVQGCLHNEKKQERADDDILREYMEKVETLVFKGKMDCKQYKDLEEESARHQAILQKPFTGSSEDKKQLQKEKECAKKAVDNLEKRIKAWGISTETAEVWHQEVHLRNEVCSHLKLLYFSVTATYFYRNFTSHLKGGQDATKRMPPGRVRYCLGTYSRFFRCLLEMMEDSSIEEDTRAFLAGYKIDADARVTARNKLERALQLDEWALCCSVLMAGQIQWDLQELEHAKDMLFYYPWPSSSSDDTEKILAEQAWGWLQRKYGTPVIWQGGKEVQLRREDVLDGSQLIWRRALLVMLCRSGRIARGIDWRDPGSAILLLQEFMHWDELPRWAQENGSGRLKEQYAWMSRFLSGEDCHPIEEVEHLLKGMSQFSEMSRKRGFNTKDPLERMCAEAVQQCGEEAMKNLIGNTFCKVPLSRVVDKLIPCGPIQAQNTASEFVEEVKAMQTDVPTRTESDSGLGLVSMEKGDHVTWAEQNLEGSGKQTYVGTVDKDAHGPVVMLRNVHRHMTDDAKPYDGQQPVEKKASVLKPFPGVDQLDERDTNDICLSLKDSKTWQMCQAVARDLVDDIAGRNITGEPQGMEAQLEQLWAQFKLPKPDYRYIRKRLHTTEDRPATRCNIMQAVLRLLERFGKSCSKELQTLLQNPAYQLAKQPVSGRIILGCSAVIALSAFCVTWRGELQGQMSELVQSSILTVCGLKKGSLVVEVEGPMEGLLELHASLLQGPRPTFHLSNLGSLPIIRVELISITSTAPLYKTLECPPGVQDMDVLVPGLVTAFGLEILPRPVERTNAGGMACVSPQRPGLGEPNHQDPDCPECDAVQAQVQLPIEPGLFVRWACPEPGLSGGQRDFTGIVVRLMPRREFDRLGHDGVDTTSHADLGVTRRAEVCNIHEHMQNDVAWSSEVDVAILHPCPAPKKLPSSKVQEFFEQILSQLKQADKDPDVAIRKSAQLLSSVLKAIVVTNGLEASASPLEDLVALRDAFLLQPEVFWQIQPFTADKWRQVETYSITGYTGSTADASAWIGAVRVLLVRESRFAELSDEQNLGLERAGAEVPCAPVKKASDEVLLLNTCDGKDAFHKAPDTDTPMTPQAFVEVALDASTLQCLRDYGYVVHGRDEASNLGKGGQGSVYKASKDGKEYAIKIAKPKSADLKLLRWSKKYLERETQLHCFLTRYPHPNLVGFVQACRIDHEHKDISGWPVIVMEYVPPCREIQDGSKTICTLQDYLGYLRRKGLRAPMVDVQNIFRQVVRGIMYMHNWGVANRDIKPGNILVTTEEDGNAAAHFPMRVKLCDFGLAKHAGWHSKTDTPVGTLSYMPPEQLASDRNHKYDGHKADVWSCGTVLYNLVALAAPYETNCHEAERNRAAWTFSRLHQLKYAPNDLVRPDGIIDKDWDCCWELITRMLQADPHKRIPIEDVANHPFVVVAPEKMGEWKEENEYIKTMVSEAAYAALEAQHRQQQTKSVCAQEDIAFAQDQWRLGADAYSNTPAPQVAALPPDPKLIQSLADSSMETDTQSEIDRNQKLAPRTSLNNANTVREAMHKVPEKPKYKDAKELGWDPERDYPECPPELICILSQQIFVDPVVVQSGHTFEHRWIHDWVYLHRKFDCPTTRSTLVGTNGEILMLPNWCAVMARDSFLSTFQAREEAATTSVETEEAGRVKPEKLSYLQGASLRGTAMIFATRLEIMLKWFVTERKAASYMEQALLEGMRLLETILSTIADASSLKLKSPSTGPGHLLKSLVAGGVIAPGKVSGDLERFIGLRNIIVHRDDPFSMPSTVHAMEVNALLVAVMDLILTHDVVVPEEQLNLERLALCQAATVGNDEVVRDLLRPDNIPPRVVDSQGMTKALMMAAAQDHEAVVRLLLEGMGGQKADINDLNNEGRTALMMAAAQGHKAVVRLLLEGTGGQEADINTVDNEGRTALMLAAVQRHEAVVRLLLEGTGGQEADINTVDNEGRTALMMAAAQGHQAVVRLLLEDVGGRMADINTVDNEGRTALMLAAVQRHEAVVRLLLEGTGGQEADINTVDNEGRTALMMAAAQGHQAVVRLLLEDVGGRMADINTVDNEGKTALMMAAAQGHQAVVHLLREPSHVQRVRKAMMMTIDSMEGAIATWAVNCPELSLGDGLGLRQDQDEKMKTYANFLKQVDSKTQSALAPLKDQQEKAAERLRNLKRELEKLLKDNSDFFDGLGLDLQPSKSNPFNRLEQLLASDMDVKMEIDVAFRTGDDDDGDDDEDEDDDKFDYSVVSDDSDCEASRAALVALPEKLGCLEDLEAQVADAPQQLEEASRAPRHIAMLALLSRMILHLRNIFAHPRDLMEPIARQHARFALHTYARFHECCLRLLCDHNPDEFAHVTGWDRNSPVPAGLDPALEKKRRCRIRAQKLAQWAAECYQLLWEQCQEDMSNLQDYKADLLSYHPEQTDEDDQELRHRAFVKMADLRIHGLSFQGDNWLEVLQSNLPTKQLGMDVRHPRWGHSLAAELRNWGTMPAWAQEDISRRSDLKAFLSWFLMESRACHNSTAKRILGISASYLESLCAGFQDKAKRLIRSSSFGDDD